MADDARSDQPPIGDYALIGDCHAAALVSREASIDWCCLPRMDGGSVFGRLLDWEKGGHFSMHAADSTFSRRYLADTMVLETTLQTTTGELRVTDCITTHPGGADDPYRQLLRVVDGIRGQVEMEVAIEARFDYGAVKPWIRMHRPGVWSAIGGDGALLIESDVELGVHQDHGLRGRQSLSAGDRVRVSLTAHPPEHLDRCVPDRLDPDELDRRLAGTIEWWRQWMSQGEVDRAAVDPVGARRSALVLKALTNAPTGAIAAAPTTSLPEAVGGNRNWDYRYSWIRDSQFTVRSLGEVGFAAEADGFRRFIERSAAGSAESLQIMYGLGGRRRLTEVELPLTGYRGSRPVRIGNAASEQLQLDVYGELLDMTWRWHRRGQSPDDDYWRFLLSLVDAAADRWSEPDHGLWEMRGDPRHFVHSKVMCWAALDRGVRLAEECLRRAPLTRWRRIRDEIRASVEEHGIDRTRGCFVQAYGDSAVDAALLLLPTVDFVAHRDPRMVATADAVAEELADGELLRRYRSQDGLEGEEGAFIACTFWLAECLAHQGRLGEARERFDAAISTANDLGLFAEEYDTASHTALGNFPQGLSHLSHIAAAVAIHQAGELSG
jgi:GH15 family glucan-1,4-alpha-glucosidase